ncbi:hypothetical protein [uncultured Rikenella sp.]|uniref:hypothetical protein n=1 Tax=uncultured Rikenella sp. TaxID=368003 RepID=UPI00261107D1|nr:hypothetical protein [uncultured Rikenella sp.]
MISYSSDRARSRTFIRARGISTVARWDFISILLTAKRVKSLFTRAGDGIKFRPRALGKSSQNVPAILTISLLKRRRAVELRLASGRPGPTSRGREMLRISTFLLSPILRTVLCPRSARGGRRAPASIP